MKAPSTKCTEIVSKYVTQQVSGAEVDESVYRLTRISPGGACRIAEKFLRSTRRCNAAAAEEEWSTYSCKTAESDVRDPTWFSIG